MGSSVGGNAARTAGIVVLMVVVFVCSLLFGTDGAKQLRGGASDARPHAVLEAGEIEFAYPAGWHVMPRSALPTKAWDSSMPGSVVAGLCTSVDTEKQCAASVDLSYILFQEGSTFPALPGLERSLDGELRDKFRAFRKEGAGLRRTADGTQYLTYEFSFRRDGSRRHQLVAAYRQAGKGLIVVATGPTSEFAQQRSRIKAMLSEAAVASAEK